MPLGFSSILHSVSKVMSVLSSIIWQTTKKAHLSVLIFVNQTRFGEYDGYAFNFLDNLDTFLAAAFL